MLTHVPLNYVKVSDKSTFMLSSDLHLDIFSFENRLIDT